MLKGWVFAALLALVWTGASTAHAGTLGVWAAGKGSTFGGTGDVFQSFDNNLGGGVEAGIDLFLLSIYGEAISLGTDQYLFSANAGFSFSVGDDIRLTMGVFTGPLFFLFPEQETQGVSFSGLSQEQVSALGFGSRAELEAQFNEYLEAEKDLSRLAVGWNLGRARADVDFKLAPGIYLGVSGQAGYHYLLSGDDVAAGAKNRAIDQFAKENPEVPEDGLKVLRDAVGAEAVDSNELSGLNYEANLHLKIEIGF